MKLSFLVFLSTFYLSAQGQLLDLTADWWTEEGFFLEDRVSHHKIKSIQIFKQDKLDGKKFTNEREILNYQFNASGQLTHSIKLTPFSHQVDSSHFSFFYSPKGNIYKRTEQEGPFSFTYYFVYQEGLLKKEIKIDNNHPTGDTIHIRRFDEEQPSDQIKKTTYYNSIGRPYQFREQQFNAFNQLVYEKTRLTRSLNFSEINLSYNANQLQEKQSFTSIGKQKSFTWKYVYKKGKPDLIQRFKNGALVEKIGFTYLENGLVDAIVTRNLKDKSVSIYRMKYRFYD